MGRGGEDRAYRRYASTLTYGRALMGRASREKIRVGGLGGIYSLSVVTMVALAWRAAAVSRILRKIQSSCMIFIFTVQI